MRWGLIVILAIVVPIGTSTIRDIVAGYAALFGVFDEKTEEKLKLYTSLNRPSSETKKEMRRLFKDDDTYAAFQERIRQVLFDKTTDIVIVIIIVSISAFAVYQTVNEKVILRAATPRYPLLILEVAIDAYATVLLIAALSFLFMFGLGYFYVLNRLGASPSDLSVWKYIEYLRGPQDKDRSFVSYWRFHDYASTIGQHFSGVAFRVVVLMAFGGLAQILYNLTTSTTVTWILAAIPVVLSVLVLVLPLYSLRRVLDHAKDAVLKELEDAYDHLSLGFTIQLTQQRHYRPGDAAGQTEEGLAPEITALRGIMEETRQESTWPVKAPVAVRIIATSMIPLVYFFIQELIRELWLR
jgi:hypothetical protein